MLARADGVSRLMVVDQDLFYFRVRLISYRIDGWLLGGEWHHDELFARLKGFVALGE